MVIRSIKDPFQWSYTTDSLRVNPELVEQIELLMCEEMCRRYHKGQRQIEYLLDDIKW